LPEAGLLVALLRGQDVAVKPERPRSRSSGVWSWLLQKLSLWCQDVYATLSRLEVPGRVRYTLSACGARTCTLHFVGLWCQDVYATLCRLVVPLLHRRR
jgi:hypothetical protein